MTIAIDPDRGFIDGRTGARRAEAVALRAADAACDAYRETLDEHLRDTVRPDRVIAVINGGPGDALASAVADLGSTAFAAARAAHLAAEAGSEEDAQRAAQVAECAAGAAQWGATALAHQADADAAAQLVGLAHRAAMAAHLSADALAAYGQTSAAMSLLNLTDHPMVPFPASWRGRIEDLSRRRARMQAAGDGDATARDLLGAADSACSAASHALRTYQRSGHGTGVSRAMSRVVRIAALAACFAGCAALDMLEQRSAG